MVKIPNVLNEAKQAFSGVGTKVSGVNSFFKSELKWAATGLTMLLASAVALPLLNKIPYLAQLQSGGKVIAGLVVMAVAGLVAMLNFGVAHVMAAGLGILGAVQVLSAVLAKPLSSAQSFVEAI